MGNSFTDNGNINNGWNKLKSNIHKAAEKAIGKRTLHLYKKQHTNPWGILEVKKNQIAEKKLERGI